MQAIIYIFRESLFLAFRLNKTLLRETGCLCCKMIYPLALCLENYFFNAF